MITKFVCDRCDKEFDSSFLGSTYPGDYCIKCHLETEINYLQGRIKNKIEWLKITHIKEIKENRKKIKELKEKLNKIEV
jgi:hypothetical protein